MKSLRASTCCSGTIALNKCRAIPEAISNIKNSTPFEKAGDSERYSFQRNVQTSVKQATICDQPQSVVGNLSKSKMFISSALGSVVLLKLFTIKVMEIFT